jgi:hypothetical protein
MRQGSGMIFSMFAGVMSSIIVVLLLFAAEAPAQAPVYPQLEIELRALDAFGGKRGDGLRRLERPGPWILYGRLGVANFENPLDAHGGGMQFSWHRTGPRLAGKIYIGIHRRF